MERLTERFSNGQAAVLGCGSNCKYDFKHCENHIEDCPTINEIYEKLATYEDLEEQGRLVKLPYAVGDEVFVITKCKDIPQQLDGTLYNSDGSFGDATGYYCPYEDDCPFDGEDFDDCEKYQNKTAVFEDTVKSITIEENEVYISTENCCVYSEIGRFVFLTREQAEAELKKNK